MAPDELTGTEQAVLLVLMAECRPVPNPELKTLGPELKKSYRDRLRDKKLIEVSSGTPMVLELTDEGWRLCRELFGTEPPLGVRGQNKALYTLMKGLGRYFDRADLAPADVFAPAPPDSVATPVDSASDQAPGDDVEGRIRAAYGRLASRAGGWVGLAALRDELADVGRGALDAALLRLERTPGVSLIPEENQKTLTGADRAAAVRIGNEDNHLIAIEA
ncbi:hypothetical protein E4P42_13325 [Mycobacterium sp. PS03-16]|nr:hypothetical protein E4P42_13325 [Mycobacterium sp. PS03-16]